MIVTHSQNHVWYLTEVKLIISCNYISVIGLIYVISTSEKLCLKDELWQQERKQYVRIVLWESQTCRVISKDIE